MSRNKVIKHKSVIPAKAGTQLSAAAKAAKWVPAFAGMTGVEGPLYLLNESEH
jgi:hypothetical protein